MIAYNNTLQGTFDPWPIFAIAKTFPASNAPERGRSAGEEMKGPEVSISVGSGKLKDDTPAFVVKMQTEGCELNVWIKTDEVELLHQVRSARWDARGSLRIGMSAGTSVFWSSDNNNLSVLVGHDDETWDFGLVLPICSLDEIIKEIRAEQLNRG